MDCEVRRRYAEHALGKVAACLKEGVPVDRQDTISRFTMDSVTEFLFDKNIRSLEPPTPYPSSLHSTSATQTDRGGVHSADGFMWSFQDGLETTALRGGFLRSYLLFEFWGDRVEKHPGKMHRFIDPIMGRALRNAEGEGWGEGGEG